MKTTETIASFDLWISVQYDRLKEALSLTGAFDEDAFHDAYLSVRCGLPPEQTIEPDYGVLFTQAYRRISRRHISDTFAKCNCDKPFFDMLPDSAPEPMEEPEMQVDRHNLVRRIRNYAKQRYPRMLVLVWESRNMRDMTYDELQCMSGLSYKNVKQTIGIINTDVRRSYAHAI